MPDLEDIVYSREATVAAVSSFYTFLTKMYLPESKLVYPPPGGWPDIVNASQDILQSFGKSEEVVDLLAHLPYINSPANWNDDADAAPENIFAFWPDLFHMFTTHPITTGRMLRVMTEGSKFADIAPPHVVGLTYGARDGTVMILDTKLGIVHWDECPFEIELPNAESVVRYDPDEEDDCMPQEEVDWRYGAPAWAIPDFFELLKKLFLELHWVPLSGYTVRSTLGETESVGEEGMLAMLQGIYREHGWPDLDAYRKTECLQAVRNAMIQRYPKFSCERGPKIAMLD